MSVNNFENFKKLVEIIEILRSPQGCPWDREQDHKSLRKNLLEETYEALDAIDSGDFEELKEELGDVLLQVVLHSQIADEDKKFNIEDVAKTISEKLVRRHPHVFSDVKVKDSDEVITPNPMTDEELKMADSFARSIARKAYPLIKAKIKDERNDSDR